MRHPRSRKDLAVMLSKLEVFTDPNPKLEQYPTDCNIAAEVLWVLHLDGALEDAVIADLGCGTGILGLGALLLGAKKVYFVDVDVNALEIAQNQFKDLGNDFGTAEFFSRNVTDFSADDIELVLMNPPFGAQQAHADKVFLEKAFALSEVVVSFHKTTTMQFLEAIAADHMYDIVHMMNFDFPLKKTMEHHTKKTKKIEVVACFFVKRDRE